MQMAKAQLPGFELKDAYRYGRMTARLSDQAAKTQLDSSSNPASGFVRKCGVGMAFVLVVGTGGAITPDFIFARESMGYRLQDFHQNAVPIKAAAPKSKVRNSAENLAHVRTILKPSVTELASLFGVSRQAIYNWQDGEAIASQNETLLVELARAADSLLAEGLASSSSVLRRKLPGGKTLLEQIRDGATGDAAASSLISMVRRELEQRHSVEQRLAMRAQKPLDIDSMGTPYVDDTA